MSLTSILTNPATWEAAGSLLAGAGGGAADDRERENAYGRGQDRARADLYRTQTAGDLDRARLGLQAPEIRSRQAVLGALLKNLQPVSVNVPDRVRGSLVSYSGGLTPEVLDAISRQAGGELESQALAALMDQSDIPQERQAPELTPYQQPGALEQGVSAGSTAANLLAALMRRPSQGQPQGQGA